MSTTDTEFAAVATSPRGKGQGINSVPVRFGLIALGLGTVCGIGQALIWHGDSDRPTPLLVVVSIFTLIVLAQAAVTYFAAWKLTQNIKALRDSTEAIAAGDFDAPINVECACEVGVLADSFHKLVSRLNANLRRINMAGAQRRAHRAAQSRGDDPHAGKPGRHRHAGHRDLHRSAGF